MDFREIRKAARKQGWREEEIKAGIMFFPPDVTRPPATWHRTVSDQAAIRNFLAEMRRSGLIWPPPRRR